MSCSSTGPTHLNCIPDLRRSPLISVISLIFFVLNHTYTFWSSKQYREETSTSKLEVVVAVVASGVIKQILLIITRSALSSSSLQSLPWPICSADVLPLRTDTIVPASPAMLPQQLQNMLQFLCNYYYFQLFLKAQYVCTMWLESLLPASSKTSEIQCSRVWLCKHNMHIQSYVLNNLTTLNFHFHSQCQYIIKVGGWYVCMGCSHLMTHK